LIILIGRRINFINRGRSLPACHFDALGEDADPWRVGDRVGIGWHGGRCGKFQSCRRGDFITCANLQIPGVSYDGGYSEFVFAPIDALAHIPDGLTLEEAAPLMDAGVTTFNALRHSGAEPGDVVAIQGIGGLGHLGIQFANKFGFETVAIGRGSDKKSLALKLGARAYIDTASQNDLLRRYLAKPLKSSEFCL
jgi:propanol-preferring alcohol dehydrogenase